jgi:cysteine-rich repeat protein
MTKALFLSLTLALSGCVGADPTSACTTPECGGDPADPAVDSDAGAVPDPSGDGDADSDTGEATSDDPAEEPADPPDPEEEPPVSIVCGDGIVGDDEECDDGNDVDRDACTTACTLDRCGDGIVDMTEQCDDGNRLGSDGCTSCWLETAACVPTRSDLCHFGEDLHFALEMHPTGSDVRDVLDVYQGGLEATDAEVSFSITPVVDMPIRVEVLDYQDVLGLWVLPSGEHGCVPGSLLGTGDDVTWTAAPGSEYDVVVEGIDDESVEHPVRVVVHCGG